MEGLKVADRYAQALLDLAQENKVVDDVLNDMKHLIAVTNDNNDFHVFLNSPLIKPDKKNIIFDRLFDGFQKLSIKFIHLLTKNGREMILPIIAEEYVAKLNAIRGITPVTLTSAVQLDKSIKDEILKKLESTLKGSIELTEQIDTDLIGGFVVRMGDTQIDASVSYQLKKMRNKLMR